MVTTRADTAMVTLFKALSDETRLEIIDLLRDGEQCVCDIAARLGIKQPLLSFHLRILRDAGLLRSARVGRWVHHSLDPQAATRLLEFGRDLRQSAKGARVVHCC